MLMIFFRFSIRTMRQNSFFLILIQEKKSFLVYKFVCARCNSCYIGETCRHFKTRIDEHAEKDKKSNIYKHLNNNEECFSSFNSDCFSILDYAPTQFQVKIKECMYIDWEKPNLNKQLNHLATTLSI